MASVVKEKEDKEYGRDIELANLWYLPQKYNFRNSRNKMSWEFMEENNFGL